MKSREYQTFFVEADSKTKKRYPRVGHSTTQILKKSSVTIFLLKLYTRPET